MCTGRTELANFHFLEIQRPFGAAAGIAFSAELRYDSLKWKEVGLMICSVRSLAITGIQGSAVAAECYISNGLPGFDIVGLPDAAVKEARERVRAAAKNSGLSFPVSRITVNLAPANVKKAGTQYDLPIALSILAASGSVRRPSQHTAFLGELSLDGRLRPIAGVLPMALAVGAFLLYSLLLLAFRC